MPEEVDVFAEMAADAMQPEMVPDDKKLKGIAGMAHHQLTLENTIAETEQFLKAKKEELLNFQTRDFPAAMQELGLMDFTLESGDKITITSFVSASISSKNKPEAHQWLIDNGHGDLIKHTITADVGRESELAEKALKTLSDMGLEPSDKEAVHSGTLKVFVREQVTAGKPLPLELFGAYMGQKSTIKKG